MTRPQALLLGGGTFVVGLALSIAVFAALDVKLLFLVGPAMILAFASYSAYRSAAADDPHG